MKHFQAMVVIGVVSSGCWVESAPDSEVETLLEEPEAEVEVECTLGHAGIASCGASRVYDVAMTPLSSMSTLSSSYGGTASCPSQVVIQGFDAPGYAREFEQVSARPRTLPTRECDCLNLLVRLEWVDLPCEVMNLPGGACASNGTCSQSESWSCCEDADCPTGEHCTGQTFVDPGMEVVQCETTMVKQSKTMSGQWVDGACEATLTLTRFDTPSLDTFFGGEPQFRAGVVDRRTGAKKPVIVEAGQL